MKERERILDLVKKGILSTEEGLDLLESMATEKDEKQIAKEADKVTASHKEKDQMNQLIDDLENGTEDSASETVDPKAKEKEDQENLERILDELATEANKTSARLDEVNARLAENKAARNEKQETLMQLNTKEELGELSDEELETRQVLEAEIKELEVAGDSLVEEQLKLEAELKDIRKNQWTEKKETLADKFELPDDWKDQATDTLNQVGEKMSEAGSQLGKFLKKTFQTVSETVNDNMEWKDVNLRVPGIATTKFDHEFYYDAPEASIIDIKAANGNVTLKTWESEDVKVEAKIKLYGKMNGEPFEAFSERSQIEVNEERISFQIPNKRVRADLVFYLPKRIYDHTAIKLLNGNITIEQLEAKDIYAKSTNGNILVNQLSATMLEIEGVNGNIDIRNGDILDSIIETVNGTVTFGATPENLSVSLVNGDVRLTIKEDRLKKIEASSVNGNVKVALPAGIGMEGHAKTSLGSINSRLSDYEIVREKKERTNQMLQFRRVSENGIAQIQLSTTTGNIFLKDTDK
ncbi:MULTISPECIES: daptomycin-sensing surface protein LiaX [unclassified Enterococcus]|uniref:daptomycin-sensing surface protein LiaX n=1 Tax=unclassified Enterococcus TaxID=2608891 RepID=UPI0013EA029D|nr:MULTISPECIES: daptomycin-sensing surface protein LiaX [unclassified Enterococcus]